MRDDSINFLSMYVVISDKIFIASTLCLQNFGLLNSIGLFSTISRNRDTCALILSW